MKYEFIETERVKKIKWVKEGYNHIEIWFYETALNNKKLVFHGEIIKILKDGFEVYVY